MECEPPLKPQKIKLIYPGKSKKNAALLTP
jgi:hypothetical protein